MQLRKHQLMSYRGVPNWPPIWVQPGGEKLQGEIGVLVSVKSDASGRHAHLGVEIEGRYYLGTLIFDNNMFCWLVTKTLRRHIGRTIEEIGAIDLSPSL